MQSSKSSLAALTLGWPVSASFSGRFYLRIGFRNTALVGLVFAVLGTASLAFFASTPSVAIVAISCFVIGLGMGLISTAALIAAQSSVPWNERGVVTGTNLFSRSIGSAVGVAVFGAIANGIFAASARGEEDPAVLTAASGAVFLGVFMVVVATIAAAFAMPRMHTEYEAATA